MIIGVDIGGTKVAAGLVDSTGGITHKTRVPMIPAGDAATGFAAVVNAVEAIFGLAPEARGAVTGIGLCAPGPLDPRTGVVLNPPNVPCWRGFRDLLPPACTGEKSWWRVRCAAGSCCLSIPG